MFKKIIAASIVALTVTNSSFAALATTASRAQSLATTPVVSYLSNVAKKYPVPAAALGAAVLANAAARVYPHSMDQIAQTSAGVLASEATKLLADNAFDTYLAPKFAPGSHTLAFSKAVTSAAIVFALKQAITAACAYATGTTAKPGAKLASGDGQKYFATGMFASLTRIQLSLLWDLWKPKAT